MSKKEIITIDCTGKALGRLSTEVAILLMGKNRPEYRPNIDLPLFVQLDNWKDIVFTGQKLKNKMYYSHSGYIGSIKSKNLEDLWLNNPQYVITHSIEGMLPKNKLQAKKIKRLIFNQEK